MCELVHKMIRKKPEERYANGKEIIDDLKKVLRAIKDGDDTASELTLTEFPILVEPEEPVVEAVKPLSQRFYDIIFLREGFRKYILLWLLLAGVSFGISMTFRSNPLEVAPRMANRDEPISVLYSDAISEWDNESLWLITLEKCEKSKDTQYLPKVYEHLTRLYVNSGRFTEAKSTCNKWIDLEKNKVRGYLLMALIAHLEDQDEKSKMILEREVLPHRDSLDRNYSSLLNRLIEDTET